MTSSVYMIRAGDFVKIGKAANPDSRIRSFRTGNPFRIFPLGTIEVADDSEALRLEHEIHRYAQDLGLHHHNEWYRHDRQLELTFAALGDARLPNGDPTWMYNVQTIIGNAYVNGWPELEPEPIAMCLAGAFGGAVTFYFMEPNGLDPEYMLGWSCGLLWADNDGRFGPSAMYHRNDGELRIDSFDGESVYFTADRVGWIRALMREMESGPP